MLPYNSCFFFRGLNSVAGSVRARRGPRLGALVVNDS